MTEESLPPTIPSGAAVHRLQSQLRDGIAWFSDEVVTDLSDVGRAVSTDREDIALDVLRDHIARLEVFSADVKRMLAGAVVEREAEGVVDAVITTPAAPATPATAVPAEVAPGPGAAQVAPDPAPRAAADRRIATGIRRGLFTATCIVTAAVLMATGRGAIGDRLLAAVTAAEVGGDQGAYEAVDL